MKGKLSKIFNFVPTNFNLRNKIRKSYRSVMAKLLDSSLEGSKFELQSRNSVDFRTNILGKGSNLQSALLRCDTRLYSWERYELLIP